MPLKKKSQDSSAFFQKIEEMLGQKSSKRRLADVITNAVDLPVFAPERKMI